MIYVFDSSPLIDLFRYYYRQRFPTLWENFDTLISEQTIISVKEVYNELQDQKDSLSEWAKNHREIFLQPSASELVFVTEIFKVGHFQAQRQDEPVFEKPHWKGCCLCMINNQLWVCKHQIRPLSNTIAKTLEDLK